MQTAPGIPTSTNDSYGDIEPYNPKWDSVTSALTDRLNAVSYQVPTMTAFVQRQFVANHDVGILPDSAYNVGYHQVPVDNQVNNKPGITMFRYESPDTPVSHTPFAQAIVNSMGATRQVSNPPYSFNLRAPNINEGFN